MPRIHVTTDTGKSHIINAKSGTALMESLNAAGLVEGTCGGAASCGTCHIYFKNDRLAGTRKEDEGYMLEGLEEFVEIRKGSRLSCQVKVADFHDGIEIEIAPEA